MALADSAHHADPVTHSERIEDPRVLAQFLSILVEQHHPLGPEPRAQCSCGEMYVSCQIGRAHV